MAKNTTKSGNFLGILHFFDIFCNIRESRLYQNSLKMLIISTKNLSKFTKNFLSKSRIRHLQLIIEGSEIPDENLDFVAEIVSPELAATEKIDENDSKVEAEIESETIEDTKAIIEDTIDTSQSTSMTTFEKTEPVIDNEYETSDGEEICGEEICEITEPPQPAAHVITQDVTPDVTQSSGMTTFDSQDDIEGRVLNSQFLLVQKIVSKIEILIKKTIIIVQKLKFWSK